MENYTSRNSKKYKYKAVFTIYKVHIDFCLMNLMPFSLLFGKKAALASTQVAEVYGLATPNALPSMEFP